MIDITHHDGPRPNRDERLDTYLKTVRALKERSALREVMERELLLTILGVNHSSINEYPMLPAQRISVAKLLCGRADHPGYEFIHDRVANFIVRLSHYGKAKKIGDSQRASELQAELLNAEAVLLRCIQGVVYAMALITDNFEEIVLRYFGQQALKEYTALIEKHELNEQFWTAFVDQFVASRVNEAHREILQGEKYTISKERSFLVIRFLFDDILSKLNPTDQQIDKTRIQKAFIAGREEEEGQRRAKIIQAMLVKGLKGLSQFEKFSSTELLHAARISCVDTIGEEFVTAYEERIAKAKAIKEDPVSAADTVAADTQEDQARFKFLMEQLVGSGVGAAIAIGVISDNFVKALEAFVPDQIKGIRPLVKDFSISVLEKILFFLLENHTIQILKECGRDEGGKIQVRSGRARRVSEAIVDELPSMSKIRKKQLFGNDVTREGTLLFKAKTAQQMTDIMKMLSLEPELQAALVGLWKKAVFRVDIMVLVNLELVAKTTTNLKTRLGEILAKYGISRAV